MENDDPDPKSMTQDEDTLRFSREQGFFDRSFFVRILIIAGFLFSLFYLIHFREIGVEIPEYKSVAPKYFVAQTDFSFFDEEATAILKQEAVREIGKIYRLSEKEIEEKKLALGQQLLRGEELEEEMDGSGYEQLNAALDQLYGALTNLRFTDLRTLQNLQELEGIEATRNYYAYTPAEPDDPVFLPRQVWKRIQRRNQNPDEFSTMTLQVLIRQFQKVPWILEEDIRAQKNLREAIKAEIPPKFTHVSAGNRMIDQGEVVTARHIAMLQAMKQVLSEKRNLWHPLTLAGSLLLSLVLTVICGAYIFANHKSIFRSNRRFCLLIGIILFTFVYSKAIEYFLISAKTNLVELVRYPLLVPVAALLIRNLMNAPLAIFVSTILTILFSLTLAFESNGFMMLNLVASLVVVLSARSLKRRKEVFLVCMKGWIGCAITIFGLHFYENTIWSGAVIADLTSSAIFMVMTAVIVLAVLPIFESVFGIMSDVTLMEYLDPNHSLLRRLSFEAPGTYQHTLVVCNLAEAAALSIGANGLFCRVASLYHDIGKMTTPQYFTENQQGEVDIHKLLTPIESSQAIIAHVTEGVAMARKSGLPEQFIDIIKEHHGTTLVYYFYRKQVDLMGGDPTKVDESQFRYSGPTPRSKESAIIMIADSFEAASRSLETFEEKKLMSLINELIRHKAEDGQFDQCLLTFEELGIAKQTMVKTLVAGSHSRVKYPSRENPEEALATA